MWRWDSFGMTFWWSRILPLTLPSPTRGEGKYPNPFPQGPQGEREQMRALARSGQLVVGMLTPHPYPLPQGNVFHLWRKSVVSANANSVNDQLYNHPQRNPPRTTHEIGQRLQPAAKASHVSIRAL